MNIRFTHFNFLVDVLCEAGCNLMNQDLATGLDSLHLAVTYNRTDIVNLLVHRYGANPNVKNTEGINSFHLCARAGNNGEYSIIRIRID